MKIGIDARMLGVRHGGIGRYVFELIKHLIILDRGNLYFLFYNKENLEEVENLRTIFKDYKNVSFIEVNIRHYSFSEQIKFPYILNKYNLDLVHFPNFNFPIFYKKPFVVTIHDMVHHKIGGAKKSHYLHFLAYKKVIEKSAKMSQKIITVSETSKKDIIKFLAVPEHKVQVIYPGGSLSTEVRPEKILEVKQKYYIDKPYFLFVGVLERKKNVVNLARGFDLFIKNTNSEIDLVLAGKPDKHYPDIKHHALDITNSKKLVFTDYVEDSDLEALYAGCLAYVNASVHEGFGLPGVEAMRFGKPLLVSNTEVFNEIYDDAALYFNPEKPKDIAEKLEIFVQQKDFLEHVGKKAKSRSEYFDWKNTATKTLEVYNLSAKL